MLTYNTMRFGTDTFTLSAKQALYIAKEPFSSDFEWTHLDHFEINADLPTGSNVRFAFYSDTGSYANQVFTLFDNGSGHIASQRLFDDNEQPYTIDNITAEVILEQGNTIAELQSLSGMELAPVNIDMKRLMCPVIALEASGDYPSVMLKAHFEKRETILDDEDLHRVYFDEPRKLIDVQYTPTVTGAASADLSVAYRQSEDEDYSDYLPIKDAIGLEASQFKFRAALHVDAIANDNLAKIGRVDVLTTTDFDCPVFGEYADIYSATRNYFLPLKYCSVIVKHSELTNGANIKAFVTTAPNKYSYSNKVLGTSDGSAEQTFTLPTNKYFDPNTLRVYVNAERWYDFRADTDKNTITLRNAPAGLPVAYSVIYNLKDEDWIELAADATQHDISDGRYVTRFHCPIVNNNAFVSAIRIRLFRGEDSTKDYTYTATGQEQSYKYLSAVDDAQVLNDIDWEYDSATRTITFTAPEGETVTVRTTQFGDAPKVYSWTAGYFV